MAASTHYLICTSPRTGSSFLCAALRNTGSAGMRQGSIVGAEYLLVCRVTIVFTFVATRP